MAPAGLLVYVYKESDFRKALDGLMRLYGKQTKEGAWPVLPNGSRMRFIPLVHGVVRNSKVRRQLTERIKWQITAKAMEEVMDLPLIDVFTEHDYLGGNSLAHILQGILSKEKNGISIFRHVTRKWTINPENKEYEITAHYYMREEANNFMKNIETYLKDNYGDESLKHIRKRRNEQIVHEDIITDNDAVTYILGMDDKDNNEVVLEEGFRLLVGQNHEAKPDDDSTIHVSDASKDTYDSDDSTRSRLSMSSYSMISRGSVGSQVQWSPSVKDKESQRKRKIKTSLSDLEMSNEDLEKWKLENPEVMQTLQTLHSDEYKITKAIFKIITKRREKENKKQRMEHNDSGQNGPGQNT